MKKRLRPAQTRVINGSKRRHKRPVSLRKMAADVEKLNPLLQLMPELAVFAELIREHKRGR